MSLVQVQEKAPGVIEITLNEPASRNAMSTAMAAEFSQAVASVRAMQGARVAVLTGAGQAFSGGGHLEMLFEKTKLSRAENQLAMEDFYRRFLSLQALEIPVIAAINGHAIGAGLCLALACDIRIAKSGAKLGLNFVRLGLHPGMGATYFLPRLVGPAKAAELLYAGKIVSAEEACDLGIVNRVCAEGDFTPAVDGLAGEIAGAGPQAVRELKESLRLSGGLSLEASLRREAICQALDYEGREFLEGITAAKEKRKANF